MLNSSPENVPFLQRGATATRLPSYTLHTAPGKAAPREGRGTRRLFLQGRRQQTNCYFFSAAWAWCHYQGNSAPRNGMKRRPSFCLKEKAWGGGEYLSDLGLPPHGTKRCHVLRFIGFSERTALELLPE